MKYHISHDEETETLNLKDWEIDSIISRKKEMIITKHKLDELEYSLINNVGDKLNIEIYEISPLKFSMLDDITVFFCGLSSVEELRLILKVRYPLLEKNDILWIQKIRVLE